MKKLSFLIFPKISFSLYMILNESKEKDIKRFEFRMFEVALVISRGFFLVSPSRKDRILVFRSFFSHTCQYIQYYSINYVIELNIQFYMM